MRIKVKPERIVAGVTKARIVVKSRADGFTPSGKIKVRVAGTTYKVRLKDGKGFVMMTLDRPRKYVAKIKYSGDAYTESARARKAIRVNRR